VAPTYMSSVTRTLAWPRRRGNLAATGCKRPRRRDIAGTTTAIRAALRSPQLAQPPQVTAGGAAVVRALAAVLTAPNEQITVLEGQVDTHFSPHPDAEIILSRTGTGRRTRPPVTSSGSRPKTARTRGPAG
jgi:hypothetical protein